MEIGATPPTQLIRQSMHKPTCPFVSLSIHLSSIHPSFSCSIHIFVLSSIHPSLFLSHVFCYSFSTDSSSTQHLTAVSPGITQNMLASALASVSPPSSEPSSLPSTSSGTSFRQPPQPSISGPSSLSSSLTYGREEGSSSGPSSLPGRSSSQPGSGGVSPLDLQMALQSVVTVRYCGWMNGKMDR